IVADDYLTKRCENHLRLSFTEKLWSYEIIHPRAYCDRTASTQPISFASKPRLALPSPRCSSSRCSIGSNASRRTVIFASPRLPLSADTTDLHILCGWRSHAT